jgi:hypothetical protein
MTATLKTMAALAAGIAAPIPLYLAVYIMPQAQTIWVIVWTLCLCLAAAWIGRRLDL